ncbi:MAG: hypothetical protein JJ900_04800 [Rhodospirillales bacterium]|nr:hypothetical protein [Rhodospirillales bacterium]MBO6786149.1 hypothetical protein [Rhodospirillales bacterium]
MIVAASIFLLTITTLGGLGMLLAGLLLNQIGMPAYVIWPITAGLGLLSIAGGAHVAQAVWRHETQRLDSVSEAEPEVRSKSSRKTSRAA